MSYIYKTNISKNFKKGQNKHVMTPKGVCISQANRKQKQFTSQTIQHNHRVGSSLTNLLE